MAPIRAMPEEKRQGPGCRLLAIPALVTSIKPSMHSCNQTVGKKGNRMNRNTVFPALIAALALGIPQAHAGEKQSDALKAAIIGGVVVGGAALVLKPHHHKHPIADSLPDHRFDQGMSYPNTIPLAPGPVILPHAVGGGVESHSDRPGPVGTGVSPLATPLGAGVSPQAGPYLSPKPVYDSYKAR